MHHKPDGTREETRGGMVRFYLRDPNALDAWEAELASRDAAIALVRGTAIVAFVVASRHRGQGDIGIGGLDLDAVCQRSEPVASVPLELAHPSRISGAVQFVPRSRSLEVHGLGSKIRVVVRVCPRVCSLSTTR